MSRCLLYNGKGATDEALIKSIKLQYENNKSEAERKKEERAKKEKKENGKSKDERKKEKKAKKEEKKAKKEEKRKRKREEEENRKSKLQKLSKDSVDFKEPFNKNTTIEQFERSDLTNEHVEPIISHKRSYSSDSTQDSIKRKREDSDLPDVSIGIPTKIRLVTKLGSDSNEETDPQGLCGADVESCSWSQLALVSNSRCSGITTTSGRENNAATGVPLGQTKLTTITERPAITNNNSQGLQYPRRMPSTKKPETRMPSTKKPGVSVAFGSTVHPVRQHPTPSVSVLKPVTRMPNTKKPVVSVAFGSTVSVPKPETRMPNTKKPVVSVASGSKKMDLEDVHHVGQHSTQSVMPSAPRKIDALLPSAPRKIDVKAYDSGVKPLTPFSGLPDSDLSKNKSSVIGKKPVTEIGNRGITKIDKKENRVVEKKEKERQHLSRHEKKMKKMRKMRAKYEELVINWVPPVLVVPVDDEDWLKIGGGTKRCVVTADVETASSLADADVHALPYTIPFF